VCESDAMISASLGGPEPSWDNEHQPVRRALRVAGQISSWCWGAATAERPLTYTADAPPAASTVLYSPGEIASDQADS
jgi:hypothetical protein